jgi:hypothetical protein
MAACARGQQWCTIAEKGQVTSVMYLEHIADALWRSAGDVILVGLVVFDVQYTLLLLSFLNTLHICTFHELWWHLASRHVLYNQVMHMLI